MNRPRLGLLSTLALSISIVWPAILKARDVSKLELQIARQLIEKQEARAESFGNLTASWIRKRVGSDNAVIYEKVDFWSRSNQFFRLDISTTDLDQHLIREIRRTVVRPEGYVLTVSASTEQEGAIVEFGDKDKGMKRIVADLCYCTANRDTTFRPLYKSVRESLTGGLKCPWANSCSLTINGSEDPESLSIISKFESETGKTREEVFVDGEASAVRECKSRTDLHESPGQTTTIENVFEDQWLIPSTFQMRTVWDDGAEESVQITLESHVRGPADMSLFNIERLTDSSTNIAARPWARRGMIFGIGLILVSLYWFFRRRTKKQ